MLCNTHSNGYSWEGIRQVRATLLGARHVPERLCGGHVYLGRFIKCQKKENYAKYCLVQISGVWYQYANKDLHI